MIILSISTIVLPSVAITLDFIITNWIARPMAIAIATFTTMELSIYASIPIASVEITIPNHAMWLGWSYSVVERYMLSLFYIELGLVFQILYKYVFYFSV